MKVCIIGSGAAGMMVAASLAERHIGAEIVLLDKNPECGKKVIISGGGRCNVTTGLQDIQKVLECYPRGKHFLHSAFAAFSPREVYAWFEAHGVPLKVEKDLRVFPVSNDGRDVVGVFENIFIKERVDLRLSESVMDIEREEGGGFAVSLKSGEKIVCDKVVLTTGGQAYRQTGSTGDGYAFSQKMGHTITALAPSLNSFFTKEKWVQTLAGVSLARVKLSCKTKKMHEVLGPILFTHRGISGPAVFALSSHVAFEMYDANTPLLFFVDLLPDMSILDFQKEVEIFQKEHPKKDFINMVSRFFPHSLALALCETLEISGAKNNCEVSKKDLHRWMEFVKKMPLHAVGRGAGDEFVTAGGVNTKEVESRTMESKICPGLFFAGEILDVDGFTGGFNLQASWATGFVAGQNL